MHWYLVHTKPRNEQVALENLQRQGFECYLPLIRVEKARKDRVTIVQEPLFPRYLFIRLGSDTGAKSWAPIRSTLGVSRLVSFGTQPAKVQDALVDAIREVETSDTRGVTPLFSTGESVQITQTAFAGIEGVFQMLDGERRALVLIEMMSKPVVVAVPAAAVRRLG